jgi:hypothetical protein
MGGSHQMEINNIMGGTIGLVTTLSHIDSVIRMVLYAIPLWYVDKILVITDSKKETVKRAFLIFHTGIREEIGHGKEEKVERTSEQR